MCLLFLYSKSTYYVLGGEGLLLTENQEAFCRNVVSGMTLSDAYRQAYKKQNLKSKTVNEKASRLAADDKIKARINELRDMAASDAIMSATERLEYLSRVIRGEETEPHVTDSGVIDCGADFNVKIKSIDIMNKMQGSYTSRLQIEGTYEGRLKEVIDDEEY